MIYTTIAVDGESLIPPANRDITERESTTIMIESNSEAATVIIGYADVDNAFQAYPDGDITTSGGAVFNHGQGVKLMVSVSGLTSSDVKLAQSV